MGEVRAMEAERGKARLPEDITTLFVERINGGDVDGGAELYAADAVMAYPPGRATVGREAIRQVLESMVAAGVRLDVEDPLPTLYHGDVALTSTPSTDGRGSRVQVVHRQADGRMDRGSASLTVRK
jgi:ketosteroid isomerase-like protein